MTWVNEIFRKNTHFGQLFHIYNIGGGRYRGYSGTFHPSFTLLLKGLPIIADIEKDHVASINNGLIPETVDQTNSPWNLARIWQNPTARSSTYRYFSNAGQGCDVYVLDTGINTGMPP
jgi:hypothetical protein